MIMVPPSGELEAQASQGESLHPQGWRWQGIKTPSPSLEGLPLARWESSRCSCSSPCHPAFHMLPAPKASPSSIRSGGGTARKSPAPGSHVPLTPQPLTLPIPPVVAKVEDQHVLGVLQLAGTLHELVVAQVLGARGRGTVRRIPPSCWVQGQDPGSPARRGENEGRGVQTPST